MTRRLLPIVLILLLALAVAACGNQPAPGSAAPTAAASGAESAEPTTAASGAGATAEGEPATGAEPSGAVQTVTFRTFGDPAEQAAYQSLVDEFNAAHPDIQVEFSHIANQADYRTQLATDFAAGTPPDVSLMNYRRIAEFIANDQLELLGPFLDRSTMFKEDEFYPAVLDAFRWQGTLACIPQNLSSLVVYYNQDLFDAAGLEYPADDWSWDDFVTAAKALTQDTDGDGFMDQYGLGTEVSFYRATPFVWQNGGAITDSEENPTRLTLTNPQTLEALQWFVDLRMVHGVVPTREEEAAEDSESRFVAGTTAMYLNSRRVTPSFREIESFAWDVAPLPRGKVAASILHTDGYCLSSAAANKEAAWQFIEFANAAEGQRIVAATGRTVPSLVAVAESEAFLTPDVAPARSRVFLDVAPDLRTVPVISTWTEIENTVTEELDRAFYGDITVQEAAQAANTRTDEYFLQASKYYGQ